MDDYKRLVFTQAKTEQLYGPLGTSGFLFEDWKRILGVATVLGELEKLTVINRFFNLRLRFLNDAELWKVPDYWATPVETLVKGAGDCEDYAIAKYFSLVWAGLPPEKLRITYVKAVKLNQAHMVLTYHSSPQAVPLVLDNLIDRIEPTDVRTDLIPVYSFNVAGLWLPGATGDKLVGDSKQLSKWQDVLKRIQAEGTP